MDNSIITDIKDRLNVADIISSYIPVKKAGANYKATCPFHHEKSASLMISPSKQIWHCFGCGEGGNVFSFVMKYENLEFPEALKILAERAGVQLPKYTRETAEADKRNERLVRVNELAAEFYAKVLEKSTQAEGARQYLKGRGLAGQTLKEWQIGFAPDDFHALENVLMKKGFTKSELIGAGVSAENERGEIHDRFFNRITFPIKNYSGSVAGFTARVLDANAKAAKYVNSPQTAIYNKSKIIFGLYQAKQSIRKSDCAIVVEGNMDAVSCHQAGFKNVIASSGTAFTFEQLQTLARLTRNLKFAFDADSAGDIATKRALDPALRLGFNIYIIKIEGAKDPDELIQKNRAAFAKAVEEAPLYLDYFFEKEFARFDPASIESKKKLFATLLPLVAQLSDPLEKDHYIRKLSQKTFVPEKTVFESIIKYAPNAAAAQTAAHSANFNSGAAPVKKTLPPSEKFGKDEIPVIKSKYYLLEQHVLGYALFDEAHFEKVREIVNPDDFHDENIRKIYEFLLAKHAKTGIFRVENFIESFNNAFDKNAENLRVIAQEALFVVESEYDDSEEKSFFDHDFREILNEFKIFCIKQKMSKIISDLSAAETNKDKAAILALNQKFLELSKALKERS